MLCVLELKNRTNQVYTIATPCSYRLEARGARGGLHGGGLGGYGAKVVSTEHLLAGDRLVFVVGQAGWPNPHHTSDWGGGGGGGSTGSSAPSTAGGSGIVVIRIGTVVN